MSDRVLAWKHKGWLAREFELREGERVLATLRQRALGFAAHLDVDGRRWTVRVRGALRWTLEVVDEQGRLRASLPVGWRGRGVVTLADGRRFPWDAEEPLGRTWALDDEARVTVARVLLDRFLRMDARVLVHDDHVAQDDLLALLAVTWMSLVVTTQAALVAGG